MHLMDALLAGLPNGITREVCIGLHWTAVVIERDGQRRCGLASTLPGTQDHHREPDVPQAGQLEELSGRALAALASSQQPTLRSVAFAAINALLPQQPSTWADLNAEEVIAAQGVGKTVALIGHFPFVERLRLRVGTLHVLEQRPQPGDLPAEAAPDVLPAAELVAITGLTLLNGTLEGLLALCAPGSTVLLLGPSTPLSPVLFDYGIDLISGMVVTDIEPVLRHVRQGANFRQVHRSGGVRLVTLRRPTH